MRITSDTFIIQIKGTAIAVVIDTNKIMEDPEVVKLVLNSHVDKIMENDRKAGKTVEIALCDEGGTTIYYPEVIESVEKGDNAKL